MHKILYYFNNKIFDNLEDFKEYIEINTIINGYHYIFTFYTNTTNKITLFFQSYNKIINTILYNYTYMEINENICKIT
jgi:hypothetical protein